ncbi:hypothetical protein E2R58_04255 [Paenibacillus amylolyticus]|uniref:hypothetical protein n=1 Tax=Paenibacillus TaxID=44249 RepID=UPI0010597A32|nr:hypothetical protein [Paenibacillus amylolyticus]TDL68426.1 hypothetical protein E2R58_04255 [Paenibacillus amylolyticus]
MNSTWLERVKNNILPVSEEQIDVLKALKEWVYEGDMYDVEIAEETCELCDHPHIRYQFEIVNIINSNTLQIGSECINRFEIGVLDNKGVLLSSEKAKKKVNKDKNKLVTEAKVKSVINSLVSLSKVDNEFEIESFIKYLKDNGAFTPKQLSTLIWRLEKYKINHIKSHFKLTIKKNKDKDQLLELADYKVKQMWDCLSSSQKNFYSEKQKLKKMINNLPL